MTKKKKWALLYIPFGGFVYQRKDADGLFIFLTRELAVYATTGDCMNQISIAFVEKREKPDYNSWSRIMNSYILNSSHTHLRTSSMLKIDIEDLGMTNYRLKKEEFEIIELEEWND